MKKQLEKLIKEYQGKIFDVNIQIEDLDTLIRENRNKSEMSAELKIFRSERTMREAQKQAYVTAEKDFDSLLDYV